MLFAARKLRGFDTPTQNTMMVIRTFVAILIAPDLKAKIAEVQDQVKMLAPDVKWVAPECFHVTLKFLGDIREDALTQIFSAVNEAAAQLEPFDISFSGLGAFPNPSRARVIWVSIDEGKEQMRKLAEAVDAALAKVGYAKEEKAFKAHVTIGRVKDNKGLGGFARGIDKIDAKDFGRMRVTGIAVMQSELQKTGPVYSQMSESKLF
ncbi:MAG: RNA 2',3'-cyclic phosphodiesterase [Armatimonadetes bacterium]|nr:RNA 2',3'-cyclic phosphodiesterase [Armatimonadota bacterium]